MKIYQPERVDICSLVTALPDEDAADGLTLGPLTEDRESSVQDLTKTRGLDRLTPEKQQQLLDLLLQYQDVFKDVPDIADFPAYHLDTGDSKPISQPPYRPGLMWRDRIKQEMKNWHCTTIYKFLVITCAASTKARWLGTNLCGLPCCKQENTSGQVPPATYSSQSGGSIIPHNLGFEQRLPPGAPGRG